MKAIGRTSLRRTAAALGLLAMTMVAPSAWGQAPMETGADAPAIVQSRHTSSGDATMDVELSLDHAEMTVAQRLVGTLSVSTRPDAVATLPVVGKTLGDFNVVSSESTARIEGGLLRTTVRYVLEPFLAGDKQVPALEVHATDGARKLDLKTEAVSIKVNAIAEASADERTALGPARAPVALLAPRELASTRVVWISIAGSLAAALASMGAVALHRRRVRMRDLPVNRVGRELDALAVSMDSVESPEEATRAAGRLREIIAAFLRGHFALPAPTSTTIELDPALTTSPLLPQDRASLLALLADIDRIRFGPGGAGMPAVRGLVDRARAWVASVSHLPRVIGGAQ